MDLSDTSALALLMAGGAVHTSGSARAYLESLDLSPGRGLYERCNEIWEHYGEVIKNRKSCILEMSKRALGQGLGQIVILGAGFDALSLELLQHAGGIMAYEADAANMRIKERMVRKASPHLCGRMRWVDADLGDAAGLVRSLKASGWKERMPSLIVIEGVSYYLAEDEMRGLVAAFKNKASNRLILEYLLPHECIDPDRADIPARIFGAIQSRYGVPLSRYDLQGIKRLAGPDGRVDRVLDMREMEAERTGGNAHFKGSASGWIQICEVAL